MDFWKLRVENITRDVLLDFLDGAEEGQRLEFKGGGKEALKPKIATKPLTAFANSDGGRLLLGVEGATEKQKENRLDPLLDTPASLEKKVNSIFQACSPPLQAHFATVDVSEGATAGHVVVIDVQPKKHTFFQAMDGVFYLRSGASSVPAPYSTIVERLGQQYDRQHSGVSFGGGSSPYGNLGIVGGDRVSFGITIHPKAVRAKPSIEFARRAIKRTKAWNHAFASFDQDTVGIHCVLADEALTWTWEGKMGFSVALAGTFRDAPNLGNGYGTIAADIRHVHENVRKALSLFESVHDELSAYEDVYIDVRLLSETQRCPEIRTSEGHFCSTGSTSIHFVARPQVIELSDIDSFAVKFLRDWFLQSAAFIDSNFKLLSLAEVPNDS